MDGEARQDGDLVTTLSGRHLIQGEFLYSLTRSNVVNMVRALNDPSASSIPWCSLNDGEPLRPEVFRIFASLHEFKC